MKACRLLVNSPTAQGAVGSILHWLPPALSLGLRHMGRQWTGGESGASTFTECQNGRFPARKGVVAATASGGLS